MALRLRASNEATWLSAGFVDPPTALTLPAGAVTTVPMTVRNTGLRAWPRLGDTPVHLSYHWLAPDGEEILVWDGARSWLPDTVASGATVTLRAVIDGNVPPGRYRLQWDLVQEQIAWFSTLGADTATTWVEVEHWDDAPVIAALPPPIILVDRVRPSRRTLWAAAVGMWAERPLFGIGPDQFRHQVGAHLDLATFDDRTHASSLFVETFVGQGLVGLLALLGCSRPSRGRSVGAGIGSTDWPRGSSGSAWGWACLPMRRTARSTIFLRSPRPTACSGC